MPQSIIDRFNIYYHGIQFLPELTKHLTDEDREQVNGHFAYWILTGKYPNDGDIDGKEPKI